MTPATDGANAPPGNSRFEAIASSTLTGRFFGVPFFRPSVSPALLFNVWAYLLGPFAFFLFGLWRKGIVLLAVGQLLRRYFPRIAQINLVVHSPIRYIQCVSLFFHKAVHCIYRNSLIVIRSDMHTLYTQTFLIGNKLNLRKILFFLCRSFPDSPVEIFHGNKIRQSNNRDPLKIFLTSIINSGYSVSPAGSVGSQHGVPRTPLTLPPESL